MRNEIEYISVVAQSNGIDDNLYQTNNTLLFGIPNTAFTYTQNTFELLSAKGAKTAAALSSTRYAYPAKYLESIEWLNTTLAILVLLRKHFCKVPKVGLIPTVCSFCRSGLFPR